MSNSIIAFNNVVDSGTLSGGSWVTALPLLNLQSRVLGKVARSTNLVLASTKFTIVIPADKPVSIIALTGHNLSLAALIRITNAAGFSTGWLPVWPVVYDSTALSWQAINWWSGKYTADQIKNFTPNYIINLGSSLSNTSWAIEIDDNSNTAGYVQIGRLFMADSWQTVTNISYGSSLGWETKTEVQEALSGAEYFNRKSPYRVARVATEWMTENEGMASAFDIQGISGIDKEVVFLWNPADTYHAVRRQFLGRLRVLNPVEFPFVSTTKTAWEIKEII